MPSSLYEILLCYVEGYNIIIDEVEQKKDQIEPMVTFFATSDPKQVRMNEYKDELFNLER
jgi:hypothetical protein